MANAKDHDPDPDRTDLPATTGPDATDFDDYDAVETEEGDLIIYGLDRDEAWVQSDTAVSLAESC